MKKKQEANDEAYDKEIERIEALEENGAISTEEAEARKRAAEDKTAAKNAELEKKSCITREAKNGINKIYRSNDYCYLIGYYESMSQQRDRLLVQYLPQ